MKISGFSFCRNAHSLFYPFQESIRSILPLVDEFVIAVGRGDASDTTVDMISAIGSDKIRIIHTEWDTNTYRGGTEYARQTTIAKEACSGDWLMYLQADEVVHEADIPIIRQRCLDMLHHTEVEGMVFDYLHFWADYDHYHTSHGWYPREIRIIRNLPDVYSWVDAQSFRRIPNFNRVNFAQLEGTEKLKVVRSNARIFHYGWVRPPDFMQRKKFAMESQYHGSSAVNSNDLFEYGNVSKITRFKGTHPSVMQQRIEKIDWKDQLDYNGSVPVTRDLFKHEKLGYKVLTWIEQNLLGKHQVGSFKNYELLRKPR